MCCRDLPSYHLRLPAKRIFSQQQSVEFVEERRQQLNGYLQSLLAIPPVASDCTLSHAVPEAVVQRSL